MKQNKTIAVIICYIGKLPWYFEYFIHTCKFNQSIDFFIISDDKEYAKGIPTNVRLIYKTLNDINDLATQKLGFEVEIKRPYKLNDIKPAYGLLFSDLVNGYDFWGYGDIDIIFGDIRGFLTDEILCEYDIVSVRPEYISGFFSLYRNNDFITGLFKKSRHFQKIFQIDEYCALDECNHLCMELIDGLSIIDLPYEFESMTHLVITSEYAPRVKTYFELHVVEAVPGELMWEKGILTYQNQFEILLYHLISFKNFRALVIPDWAEIPNKFYINSSSITKTKETKQLLEPK